MKMYVGTAKTLPGFLDPAEVHQREDDHADGGDQGLLAVE